MNVSTIGTEVAQKKGNVIKNGMETENQHECVNNKNKKIKTPCMIVVLLFATAVQE